MPASFQSNLSVLHDLCDTLEVMTMAAYPGSQASPDVSYSIDVARLMSEESAASPGRFSRVVWDLMIRGDALLRSPEAPKDAAVMSMMQAQLMDNQVSASKIITANDLAMWNHIVDDMTAKRVFSAVREHAYRHLPFQNVTVDNDIQRRDVVAGMLATLSDVVGEGAVPAPAPKERFNLRQVRIEESLPELPGQPVLTTITYSGDPLVQLRNPALAHPEKGVVAPLDKLTLAGIARNVFYQGDRARGIAPMAVHDRAVESRIIDALSVGRSSSSSSVQTVVDGVAASFKRLRSTSPVTIEAPVCSPGR
jgi:hypothetical protein